MNPTPNGHLHSAADVMLPKAKVSAFKSTDETRDVTTIPTLPIPPMNQEKEFGWWPHPLSPQADQMKGTKEEIEEFAKALNPKAPLHALYLSRLMNRALDESEYCTNEARSIRRGVRRTRKANKAQIALLDTLLKELNAQLVKKQEELHKAEIGLADAAAKACILVTDPLTTNAEHLQKTLLSRAPKLLHTAGNSKEVPAIRSQDKSPLDKTKELITSLGAPVANGLFLALSLGTYFKAFNIRQLMRPNPFLYTMLSVSIALGIGVEFCMGQTAEHLATLAAWNDEQSDNRRRGAWRFALAVAIYVGLFALLTIAEGLGLRQMAAQLGGQNGAAQVGPLAGYCVIAAAIPGHYVYSRFRSKFNELTANRRHAVQSQLQLTAENTYMKEETHTSLISAAYTVPILRGQLKTITDQITKITEDREKLANPEPDEALLKLHADHRRSARGAHIEAMRAEFAIMEAVEPLASISAP